jgi:hypothetical protein
MTNKMTKQYGGETQAKTPAMNRTLWTIQGVLALLFLFTGGMKLALPIEAVTAQMPLPGGLLRFIGVAEVLGGIGLILPGILRIRQELTSLAAGGLVIIMIGATVLTAASGGIAPALMPFVVGLLLVIVARERRARTQWGNFAGGVDLADLRSI